MTAELLTMCEEDGPEGVAVFLLLIDTLPSRGKVACKYCSCQNLLNTL